MFEIVKDMWEDTVGKIMVIIIGLMTIGTVFLISETIFSSVTAPPESRSGLDNILQSKGVSEFKSKWLTPQDNTEDESK
jgi:hypothetical protein